MRKKYIKVKTHYFSKTQLEKIFFDIEIRDTLEGDVIV